MYRVPGRLAWPAPLAMAYGRFGRAGNSSELDARARLGTGRHVGRNLLDGPADCVAAASQVPAVLCPDGPMRALETRTGRWQGREQNDAMFEICRKVLWNTHVLKDANSIRWSRNVRTSHRGSGVARVRQAPPGSGGAPTPMTLHRRH